jgi:hypothetical protein
MTNELISCFAHVHVWFFFFEIDFQYQKMDYEANKPQARLLDIVFTLFKLIKGD